MENKDSFSIWSGREKPCVFIHGEERNRWREAVGVL